MTAKKKSALGCSLASLLEEVHTPSTIDSLLKADTLSPSLSPPNSHATLSLSQDVDLEKLVELINPSSPEDDIQHFINKYSSPSCQSLDELLQNQVSSFAHPLSTKMASSPTSLFADLDDLFNEN